MNKTKNSAWKRVVAGVLSVALVAGAMPANVGGFLTGGNGLVANAADPIEYNEPTAKTMRHTGQPQDLVVAGSVTSGNGTMEYTTEEPNKVYSAVNGSIEVDCAKLNVGDILYVGTRDAYGFFFHGTCLYDGENVYSVFLNNGQLMFGQGGASAFGVSGSHNILKVTSKNGDTVTLGLGDYQDTVPVITEDKRTWQTDVPVATEAGTYKVYWRVKENGTNVVVAEDELTSKIALDLTANDYTAPTANSRGYSGQEEPLVTGGTIEASKGSFQYALGADDENAPTDGWGAVPTAKNAGTYYVWYKIIGGTRYNDVDPQCIPVSITRSVIVPKITLNGELITDSSTITYGNECTIGVAAESNPGNGGVTIQYSTDDGATWTTEQPTDVGTYRVKATVAETTNYTEGTATAILTIGKASITVNPLPQLVQNLTYNESPQDLVDASGAGVSANGFDIQYLVTAANADTPAVNAEGWSADIPQKTDAGIYKVWYKVDGNNNYNGVEPSPLGLVEIAKAKDSINTAPEFSGQPDAETKVYYYDDGRDIQIVFNEPNGKHGAIEYAWKPADANAEWTPDWSTNAPTQREVGDYTLLYRSDGANNDNYDPSDPVEVKIEVQGFTTNESIVKFNEGQTEILRLTEDINGNVQIRRDGGIIDLNGHTIRGCLVLQNVSKPIIVMNGTLGRGSGDAIDDGGGYQPQWKGNVILSDVICNGRVWLGARTFYKIGTTNFQSVGVEGGQQVEKAGLLLNLEDLHAANDVNIKLSNQVRKAIESIQIGDGAAFNFSGNTDPDPVLFYQSGQTVKITSGARLNLTYTTTDGTYKATENTTDDGYVYTFTVPNDNSVKLITAQRIYNYQIESVGADKLVGKDTYVIPEQASHQIASLKADSHEFKSNFDNYVKMTIDENFELKTNSEYQYYSLDAEGHETKLDAKPTAVGSYRVKAGIEVPANNQTYWMEKNVEITRRNYTNHSGDKAVQGEDEIEATVTVGNSEKTYSAYSGAAQKPSISINDTNYTGTQTLKRGTDYEIYKKQDDEYVLVTNDDDLAQTNVGAYKFYVKFIGNYTSDNEYEEFTWNIISADIEANDLAPTANELTYNTEAQNLVTEGESASNYGTTYYKLVDVEGAEWSTTIPTGTNAGTYKVQWYIKGNGNYNDLGSETQPAGTVEVTISPKTVTPGIILSGDAFVYDGEEKTFTADQISVYDGTTRIAPSEYTVTYANNTNAGTNTASVIVSDNDENGNYIITQTTKNFSIAKADPTVTIALANNNGITYDGAAVVADEDFTITDTNAESDVYSVDYYADDNGEKGEKLNAAPVNAGTYWAVVTLAESDNYNAATAELKFEIQQKDISCVTIEAEFPTADTTDTPEAKAPTSLTVKDGETVLTEDDYTAEFGNNVNSTNAATITLTGKGNYTGTQEGTYSVLTTLDISAVKALITKIVDANDIETAAAALSNTFVTKAGNNITVYSTGKLQFSGLEAQPAAHQNNDGWYYTFNIPAGVNKCTATHEYSYITQQTPTDSIDANGDVVISGYDANVKSENNAPAYLDIVKVHFDTVYYLDNPNEKVTVQDVDDPAPGTSYQVISKKFFDNTGKEIDVTKPLDVGTYKVELKIRVFYGNSNQDVLVTRNFDIQARSSQNVTVSLAQDSFGYDGTAKTAEITVTDSGRAADAPMVRGKDYEFGYYDNEIWTVYNTDEFLTNINVGNYSATVRFKGNYSGEKKVTWTITNAVLPELEIIPDNDLVYDHEAHPVTVQPKNEGDVIPEGSVEIRYGGKDATANDWATLNEKAPVNAGEYQAFIRLSNDISYAFATDQITSIKFEVLKKDIESEDIKFYYPEFSVQMNPGEYLECNPITAKDANYDLAEGVDFKIATYQTNKTIEDFPVLINGMGNYTGCTYLYWDVIAKPTVALTETGVKDAANKKIWIRVNANITAGHEDAIAKTGVLVYKLDATKKATDVTADNMKIENKVDLGLVQGSKAGTTYSPSVSNGDYGFVIRPYTEMVDGTIVYGDLVENSYAKVLCEVTTASVELSEVGVKDAASKKIWIRVNTTADHEDAIAETGVLIYKLDANKTAEDVTADNMKIENKVDLGLVQGSKAGTTYSPSVSNGDYGFVMRPYTQMVDGTIVYGDLVETSYAKVVSEATTASVELSEVGVKDAASKKIWIRVNTTADHEDAIAETGVLIYKLGANKTADAVNANNMKIENKVDLGLVQGSKAGTTYSPSVSNGDYGFVMRPYTKMVDGTIKYGDLVETSYAEVAGLN